MQRSSLFHCKNKKIRRSAPSWITMIQFIWNSRMWPKSLASFNIKYMMSLICFISVYYARLTCVVGCIDACDEDRRMHLQIDDERHVRLICITLNFWNIFIISCLQYEITIAKLNVYFGGFYDEFEIHNIRIHSVHINCKLQF